MFNPYGFLNPQSIDGAALAALLQSAALAQSANAAAIGQSAMPLPPGALAQSANAAAIVQPAMPLPPGAIASSAAVQSSFVDFHTGLPTGPDGAAGSATSNTSTGNFTGLPTGAGGGGGSATGSTSTGSSFVDFHTGLPTGTPGLAADPALSQAAASASMHAAMWQAFTAASATKPAAEPAIPQIHWLNIEAPESKLLQEGLPQQGPAIQLSKGMERYSKNVDKILELLVGDVAAQVVIEHDADWEKYPEVAKALKPAGADENCICVAKSPSFGRWACGVAGGWKFREPAAKLALCVVLAAGLGRVDEIGSRYEAFNELCLKHGLSEMQKAQAAAAPEEPAAKKARFS